MSGNSSLKDTLILGYFNIIFVLIGQSLGYENDEVMNNSQSKSTHTMYNKRITTIKLADHEVLAGIWLKNSIFNIIILNIIFNLIENSDETMDNEDNSDIDKTYEPPNNDKNEMS